MGSACATPAGRTHGQKIRGLGGDVDVKTGSGYAIVCAFNYEADGDYNPEETSGCGPLTAISDGAHFANLVGNCGFHCEEYYDQNNGAPRYQGFPDVETIKGRIQAMAQQCGPDDVFVFFYAGHGTEGDSGDSTEVDGKDEEMCFVDQQGNYTPFVDNDMAALLTQFDPQTNVVIVTDCCQSATVCDLSRPELADHQVVHFAAVKDNQYAQDTGEGGAFTASLCETLMYMVNDPDNADKEGFSVTEVFNATYDHYSEKFSEQDFSFERTESVDPDVFAWPLMPTPDWEVDTGLDSGGLVDGIEDMFS